MYDYMKIQHFDKFFTIPEACEVLGMTKDELRSKGSGGYRLRDWWNFGKVQNSIDE